MIAVGLKAIRIHIDTGNRAEINELNPSRGGYMLMFACHIVADRNTCPQM